MDIVEKLEKGLTKLAVVGLGYVGLPLAAEFGKHYDVIGFDTNEAKVAEYKAGHDVTEELGDEVLKKSKIDFTTDAEKLQEASFIVIAVPTPINGDKTPDLRPVKAASKLVGAQMKKGSLVVYESTVYPGVTEEICAPILEEVSGLTCGKDFKIAYSPERINPGDKDHRLVNIRKIVSGMNEETLKTVSAVYGKIIAVGVYEAPNIKVAEAAKLVENSQRDINIAFMNELAMVFDRMNISTHEVCKAMDTKWNALGFRPGLVGGHCIGVDPYYFVYQAELLGYHSQIIAAGRRVNNGMSEFVANAAVKSMIQAGIDAAHAKVYLFGMSFKENCPDARNSRPVDVYHYLADYGIKPIAVDPVADSGELKREYGLELTDITDVKDADCIIVLVAHDEFKAMGSQGIKKLFGENKNARRVILDVKSILPPEDFPEEDYVYWSL